MVCLRRVCSCEDCHQLSGIEGKLIRSWVKEYVDGLRNMQTRLVSWRDKLQAGRKLEELTREEYASFFGMVAAINSTARVIAELEQILKK